jgi:hypothetical protein
MARSRGRSADSEQRARELRTHDRSRGARWGRERPRYTGAEVRRWLERAGEIRVAPRRTPAYVSGCSSGWGRGQRARCSSTAGADRVSARVPSSRDRSSACVARRRRRRSIELHGYEQSARRCYFSRMQESDGLRSSSGGRSQLVQRRGAGVGRPTRSLARERGRGVCPGCRRSSYGTPHPLSHRCGRPQRSGVKSRDVV